MPPHRLDRLVSGVLVIARTTEKAALFSLHLRQGFIEKEYLARVKVCACGIVACTCVWPVVKEERGWGWSEAHPQPSWRGARQWMSALLHSLP